jgi:predicted nucleic acid-binding protein
VIVVSDTSAITTLIQVERLHLLFDLFENILIPTAVRDEIIRGHSQLPHGLAVVSVHDFASVARLQKSLDLGEAEAIILSKETHADAILIDEKKGRAFAKQEGLKVIGLVAVVLLARRRGLFT